MEDSKQHFLVPKLEQKDNEVLNQLLPLDDVPLHMPTTKNQRSKQIPIAEHSLSSSSRSKNQKESSENLSTDSSKNKSNSSKRKVDHSLGNKASNKKKKDDNPHPPAGHRPVTSCTHCRQHKIKCNASERFPNPCSRCERMNLKCEIDPQFRPKKGSQIQSLRNDVDELRSKIEYLTRNENLIAQVLQKATPIQLQPITSSNGSSPISTSSTDKSLPKTNNDSPSLIAKTHLQRDSALLSLDGRSNSTPLLNDSASNKTNLNPALEAAVRSAAESPAKFPTSNERENGININKIDDKDISSSQSINLFNQNGGQLTTPVNTKPIRQNTLLPNCPISEFNLGDVKISVEKATELHKRFIENYLPYLPIMVSNNCIELYQQSQLLFWTVMLTACLSDPEPSLYISLASLIKQLAIETCWIRTPRSTHIVQSLLILGTWPLPNQKVLDDCSYRFVGLAKSLGLQLGLHRGKFISEFSRTQVALPDAEKWRSRTWLSVFFCEQFWSSNLGLPPSLQTDYLLESARIDPSLPKNYRCLICLSIFQAKLINVMGLSVTSPDGLMEPKNRAGALSILERELERLVFKLQIDDIVVEIYFLYVKLMVCLFAFLPETPSEDQTKYVTIAYLAATRIVTIMSQLLESRQLTEYPIYVRHAVTTAGFFLFRLHLTPYLLPKYIDSARQSIVTVHRLFRNMLAAWKDVENDISRTATVLEKLNFVIITHPELFTEPEGIIVRMRSHLTGSLFYDLVWNIHEARRRSLAEAEAKKDPQKISTTNSNNIKLKQKKRPLPLPFYNQITKDDFTAITSTTPNGTTVTTLVPTDQAITNAQASAQAAGLSKPTEINGIPLVMLEATGSLPVPKSPNPKMSQGFIQPSAPKKKHKRKQQNLMAEPAKSVTPIAIAPSSVPLQRANTTPSTSMSAAVNGLIPPPLFPNRQNSMDISLSNTNSNPNSNQQQHSAVDTLTTNVMKQAVTPINMGEFDTLRLNSPSALFDSPGFNRPSQNGTPGQQQTHVQNSSQNGLIGSNSNSQSPTESDLLNNDMFIDSIFQQQSAADNGDDFLGWFDMNMAPEF